MKNVLIVDDEKQIRDLLSDILADAGYSVTTAVDGEMALDILKHNNYHVIFSDLTLPNMCGFELCSRIRKTNPISIIIAVTGHHSKFDVAEFRSIGFDDCFLKPFMTQDIINAADAAFSKIARWGLC